MTDDISRLIARRDWRRQLRQSERERARLEQLPDSNEFKAAAIQNVQQQIDQLEHILENF
jgi:flagellar biosynthesis chaperone FliJ